MVGKSSFGLLGKNQLAVYEDFEDPASALDEFGLRTGLFLDGGRQTGGPREIISGRAIRDRNFHCDALRGDRVPNIGAIGTLRLRAPKETSVAKIPTVTRLRDPKNQETAA